MFNKLVASVIQILVYIYNNTLLKNNAQANWLGYVIPKRNIICSKIITNIFVV